MQLLPAFARPITFVADVLPGLVPRSETLTHLVASYRRVGVITPTNKTEISRENDLTTILFHDLTTERIQSEVIRVLRAESDQLAPTLATIYAGRSGFVEILQLVTFVLDERPDATIVIASCGCVTEEQESIVLHGLRSGNIAAAVWCECGGSLMTRDIQRAVKKNWKPAEASVQLSPLSTESSVDLSV